VLLGKEDGHRIPKVPFKGWEVYATEVDFQTRKEEWNEYQLMDGTSIKMKLVVSEIFRVPDEWDNEGNPLYVVKSQNILVTRSPNNLKRQP
jgi:hypothetical protein